MKNPHHAKLSQIKKQVRAFNHDKQHPSAPVNVLDVYYHRGTPQVRQVVSDPTRNQHQVEMTETIKSYMSGNLTKSEFVSKLGEHHI